MKKITNKQRLALKAIRNSKGRFFGLYTRQGDIYNAQFVRETDKYITIHDRNLACDFKLAKTSVDSVTLG